MYTGKNACPPEGHAFFDDVMRQSELTTGLSSQINQILKGVQKLDNFRPVFDKMAAMWSGMA